MSAARTPHTDTAAALRAALPAARAAWLFGSATQPGRMTAGSDIDLAVRLHEPLTPAAHALASAELAERLGRDVDLIDFDRAETVMQVQILQTGVPLFDLEPAATADRVGRACTEYQLIQRWRAPMMAALAQRLLQAGGAAA